MARCQVWVWIIFLLFITSHPATCETFHIIPSADSPCPGNLTGEPCITLSQYIRGEYRQYTSNPTEINLEFQPGRHTPVYIYNILFASQLVSFRMKSVNSTEIYCPANLLFRVNHVQNVHISGIHFIRCRYQIESVMNLTLEESSFSQVSYLDALYIRSSSATIKGCSFTSNHNMALHTDNSSVIIDYSTFFNNRGRRAGILIENGHYKKVVVSNSDFSQNTGSTSTHYGNEAGALSVFADFLELYNTTFVSNTGSVGGALAVYSTQSTVKISQCNFVNNEATVRGGAVFTSSSITVQQSTFSSNEIRYGYSSASLPGGGAIYATGSSISISIQLSRFLSNEATIGVGGAIYVIGSNNSLSINQNEFKNNRVTRNQRESKGGAMFVTGNNNHILIEQSSLSNNKAAGSGGAVHTNGQNTSILISESTISKNSAASCGALAINDFQQYDVKFENSMFINNLATTYSGGVLCIRNASISVDNCTFSHNRAAGNAGVFAVDDSTVTIHSSTFDNNTAGANGGVVAMEYFRTALFISHTFFTNNQGAKQGGVMYVGRKGSQVKISRSTIGFNNASRGEFATILGSSLEITTTSIFNNTAELGEVISACHSDITVSEQLLTSTDPTYSVCTLFNGDINETDSIYEAMTTDTLFTTTTTDILDTTTSGLMPKTTPMSETTNLPTEPSVISGPVYFELNGKVYPNNSVISLTEVGKSEHALLCKTDLTTCCATPPNRFGDFYYPNGDTVSVKRLEHGFYRDRGFQEVRLNRREGVGSPSGRFHCAVPDASGTIQNLFIHLLNDVINNQQN